MGSERKEGAKKLARPTVIRLPKCYLPSSELAGWLVGYMVRKVRPGVRETQIRFPLSSAVYCMRLTASAYIYVFLTFGQWQVCYFTRFRGTFAKRGRTSRAAKVRTLSFLSRHRSRQQSVSPFSLVDYCKPNRQCTVRTVTYSKPIARK